MFPSPTAGTTGLDAYDRALDLLESWMARFARTAQEAPDRSASVEACPGWDVTDVVLHTGRVHGWALSALGADERPPFPPRPSAEENAVDWYRAQADRLLQALRARHPDDPAWTLWSAPVTAFWARRQVHEVAIHCLDIDRAATSSGAASTWDVTDAQALDGIDEVLAGFHPRAIRLDGGNALPGVVRFAARAKDEPVSASFWTARTAPDDSARLLGEVHGTPEELYLALWGRAPYPAHTPPPVMDLLRATRFTP